MLAIISALELRLRNLNGPAFAGFIGSGSSLPGYLHDISVNQLDAVASGGV
jgi:hypothetical protein